MEIFIVILNEEDKYLQNKYGTKIIHGFTRLQT